jgi:hypothetical protein
MPLYIGLPLGLMALLVAFGGVASLGWGWLPPWWRQRIARPQLFGWSQLIIAVALVIQLAGALLDKTGATLFGAAVLLFGILLLAQAQRPPRGR